MPSELVKVLRALDQRPGMLLPEQTYGALVAYVEGFVAGAGSDELEGLQDWVAAEVLGRDSSFHWSVIIALPHNDRVGREGFSALSQEQGSRASKMLIELLSRYLDQNNPRQVQATMSDRETTEITKTLE